MELKPNTSMERIIGLYIIFIASLESTVSPIQLFYCFSYFIVKISVGDISEFLLFLYIGVFIFSYSLGKFCSFQVAQTASYKYSFKVILNILLFISTASMLILAYSNSIFFILVSRFFSGVGSSSQMCIRQMLCKICHLDKTDWSKYTLLILWVNRLGSVCGIFLSALLSTPSVILPHNSQFATPPWLMLSLIALIFQFSAFLLSLPIEDSYLIQGQMQSYSELPEKVQKIDEDPTLMEIRPEEMIRDNINIQKYIKQTDIIKEESIEESFNIEEVKFYSPRFKTSKESNVPKGSVTDRYENVPQSVSIDSIEEMDNSHEQSYIEYSHSIEINSPTMSTQFNELPSMRFAVTYRILSTALLALIYESLPISLAISFDFPTYTFFCALIVVSYSIGVLFKLCAFNLVLKKFSYYYVLIRLWCAGFCALCILPYLYEMKFNYFLICFSFVIIFVCIEVNSPVGCILLADSVGYSERCEVLNKNDSICILIKAFTCLLFPILLKLTGLFVYFKILTIFTVIMTLYSLKMKKKFLLMTKAPYKT